MIWCMRELFYMRIYTYLHVRVTHARTNIRSTIYNVLGIHASSRSRSIFSILIVFNLDISRHIWYIVISESATTIMEWREYLASWLAAASKSLKEKLSWRIVWLFFYTNLEGARARKVSNHDRMPSLRLRLSIWRLMVQ
jgi:hypothetical protein